MKKRVPNKCRVALRRETTESKVSKGAERPEATLGPLSVILIAGTLQRTAPLHNDLIPLPLPHSTPYWKLNQFTQFA